MVTTRLPELPIHTNTVVVSPGWDGSINTVAAAFSAGDGYMSPHIPLSTAATPCSTFSLIVSFASSTVLSGPILRLESTGAGVPDGVSVRVASPVCSWTTQRQTIFNRSDHVPPI